MPTYQFYRHDGFYFRHLDPLTPEHLSAMEVWTDAEGWIPVSDSATRTDAVFYGMPLDTDPTRKRRTLTDAIRAAVSLHGDPSRPNYDELHPEAGSHGSTSAPDKSSSAHVVTSEKSPYPDHWAPEFQATPTATAFIRARDESSRGGYLSPLSEADLKGAALYLSKDGKVGGALQPDGDMGNLFNNGGPKGAATEVLIGMLADGGKTADCFDGYLPTLYANFGLREVGRMKFNREFAPPNWNYERDGEPDVVFLARTEDAGTADAIRSRVLGDKDGWTRRTRGTTYYDDYDAARRAATAAAADARRASTFRLDGQDRGTGLGQPARGDDSPTSPAGRRPVAFDLPTIADVSAPGLLKGISIQFQPRPKKKRKYARRPKKFEASLMALSEIPTTLDWSVDRLKDAWATVLADPLATGGVVTGAMLAMAQYGGRTVQGEFLLQGVSVLPTAPLDLSDAVNALLEDFSADVQRAFEEVQRRLIRRSKMREATRRKWAADLMEQRIAPLVSRYANRAINEGFARGRTHALHTILMRRDLAKPRKGADEYPIDLSELTIVQTAVLDPNLCEECEAVHGETFAYGSERQLDLEPPYERCRGLLGGNVCRCQQLAIIGKQAIDIAEVSDEELEDLLQER